MLFCACLCRARLHCSRTCNRNGPPSACSAWLPAAHQGWSANLFTTVSDMFPRSAVGAVVGIGGMAGSVGGALLAFFTGHILQLHSQLRHPLRPRLQRVPAGAGSLCTCSRRGLRKVEFSA